MPKDDKDKDEPKPWSPDQPLDDKDDEEETQRRARATARLNHLTKQYETPAKPEKKSKKLW